MYLEYSPNNSGGSFWHTDKQWQELLDLGWVELGWRIIKKFPSFEDGMNEWQSVMQMDPEAEGYECCGPPHWFDVYTDEEGAELIEEYLENE